MVHKQTDRFGGQLQMGFQVQDISLLLQSTIFWGLLAYPAQDLDRGTVANIFGPFYKRFFLELSLRRRTGFSIDSESETKDFYVFKNAISVKYNFCIFIDY